MAAAQIPMMRELKASSSLAYILQLVAAAQIPMMRELKATLLVFAHKEPTSCSPNPYDEGTES